MKKIAFLAVLVVLSSACNYKPEVSNPSNWLRGKLVPEVSPFNENDTVLAMKVKYMFPSDYNGRTYYILKYNNSNAIQNKLLSILDNDGNRLDSIEICKYYDKTFTLYPLKTLSDLPTEVLDCVDDDFFVELPQLEERCKLDVNKGTLIFNYEMLITDEKGKIYDMVLKNEKTIHIYEMNENTCFKNKNSYDPI